MTLLNNNTSKRWRVLTAFVLLLLISGLLALKKTKGSFSGLWRTPDQQGQAFMDSRDYGAAAEKFKNPMQRGAALYKDGQFEEALKVFSTIPSPEGIYNRGNCQVMLGKYDAAIEVYGRAIKQRPDWKDAIDNRDLAIVRKASMAPPEDDAGGTGGKLEADEIVFDERAKNSKNEEVVEAGAGDKLSDDEMRALWLRKVQTKPADFLRAKFSYQLHFSESGEGEEAKK